MDGNGYGECELNGNENEWNEMENLNLPTTLTIPIMLFERQYRFHKISTSTKLLSLLRCIRK